MLYFDTDSIIFSQRPGDPTLPTGDYLGEFTSELKPGDHIVEFASAGPKNYGYRTEEGKLECKVRGFTLNARGQSQLNFDLLKANVIDEVNVPLGEPRVILVPKPTRSNVTPTQKLWKRSKKPNDTEWSSTNAWSISTPFNRIPTNSPKLNSRMWAWRTLTC